MQIEACPALSSHMHIMQKSRGALSKMIPPHPPYAISIGTLLWVFRCCPPRQVVALCREASICALEEDRSATQVRQAHLLEALGQMRPQITPAVLASYASFQGGVR